MLKTTLGAKYLGNHCSTFSVWAPFADKVELLVTHPDNRTVPLQKDAYGYWRETVDNLEPGTRYLYRLNGELRRPDPASQSQPEGVHDASEVIDHEAYSWEDSDWKGVPLKKMIIYELHTGTFSAQGNFDGIAEKLDYLVELGINAIEIMPVAQFPGTRNWGYDGVYPFAVQNSYGGVSGLKSLVDRCHQKGIAVILDVVYNHMGPEGNYLSDFGPYFTDKYHTPWGEALNFDDEHSDPVRNFFLQNAFMWLRDFHIDGLRLDAVHAILDLSANHFLKELRQSVDELEQEKQRKYVLIAESDLNDIRLISPYKKGGYGLDGQWTDDFHHAVHTLATGEKEGYYMDYGKAGHLAKAFRNTFIYNGTYSAYRNRTVGNDASNIRASKFVVCGQNHDQVGNRMLGERLSSLVSFEMVKVVAGTVLFSPYVPMLFMGEEYGEGNPFLYFVSHTDPELVAAIRSGRKKEFEAFQWNEEVPDPQATETFRRSTLQWNYQEEGQPALLYNFYRHIIKLRKQGVVVSKKNKVRETPAEEKLLIIHSKIRTSGQGTLFCVLNFSQQNHKVEVSRGKYDKILDSSESIWGGPGSLTPEGEEDGEQITVRAESIVVYQTT